MLTDANKLEMGISKIKDELHSLEYFAFSSFNFNDFFFVSIRILYSYGCLCIEDFLSKASFFWTFKAHICAYMPRTLLAKRFMWPRALASMLVSLLVSRLSLCIACACYSLDLYGFQIAKESLLSATIFVVHSIRINFGLSLCFDFRSIAIVYFFGRPTIVFTNDIQFGPNRRKNCN